MTELKLCPFCGSEDVAVVCPALLTPSYWVVCWNCGVDGPRGANTKEEAIEKWNDRKGEVDGVERIN